MAQDSKTPIADPSRKFQEVVKRQNYLKSKKKRTSCGASTKGQILNLKIVTHVSWALLK